MLPLGKIFVDAAGRVGRRVVSRRLVVRTFATPVSVEARVDLLEDDCKDRGLRVSLLEEDCKGGGPMHAFSFRVQS